MAAEPLASEGTGYEVVEAEPPEILSRNLVSAGYLLAGATAFFFIAFVFAYFYLRSLNNAGLWKPSNVDASIGWGTAIVACYVLSAILVRLGLSDHRASGNGAGGRRWPVALGLGVVGLVLQVLDWTHESFGPADGGFASVFFGWTAFLFLFVFCTLLWLEMTLATSMRYRNVDAGAPAAGPCIGRPAPHWRTTSATRSPSSAPSSSGSASTGRSSPAIAVVTWIILYLI